MTRTALLSAACLLAASIVSAQVPGAAAKAAAQKAAAATNAHIEAEQNTNQKETPKQQAPKSTAKQAPTKQPTTTAKTQAPTKGATGAKTGAKGAAAAKPVAAADTAGPPPTIYREEFEYTSGGRRDPFFSLLSTNELRPAISDLKVTGILFDPSGRRSIATLRDLGTNEQYRVTTGSALGRMRVSAIRPRVVLFTIDEFGTTRQDSLVFGDTTKVRVR